MKGDELGTHDVDYSMARGNATRIVLSRYRP